MTKEENNAIDYRTNTSYIFIPFRFAQRGDFRALVSALDINPIWNKVHDEINYMFKYIADKIDSNDSQNCQCFHYALAEDSREQCGILGKTEWYRTAAHKYHGNEETFCFQMESVQLYCFSTTVCILAFQIHFVQDNPFWISSAQYHLKKVSRELVEPCSNPSPEGADQFTLLDLAKRVVSDFEANFHFDFFYYANRSTERANVLTFLEVEEKEDYSKELYYLRRCYGEGFVYSANPELDKKEIYVPSMDTVWGISPEAAVCLACPELGRSGFIREIFYRNFNKQYLFMYVLLLHQKYVLYMLLTQIGLGIYNSLQRLEEYQHELYEFETDFVFSCVTEVPQYQNLYERMTEAFSLKKMYEDVREPLTSLSEVRRATAESEQKKRDSVVNKSLFLLSLLTFFSALIDSFDFIDSFLGWFLGDIGIKIGQVACIIFIFAILAYVIKNLIFLKK